MTRATASATGLTIAALLAGLVTTSAQAGEPAKKGAPTATVNATWTVRQEHPKNQPADENYEEWTITIKDGKAKPTGSGGSVFSGEGDVWVVYKGRFYTEDRSWHAGCDIEQRDSIATYHKTRGFSVAPISRITIGGKEERYPGWVVELNGLPSLRQVTTGFYQDWESILMENCQKFPVGEPLGYWNPDRLFTAAAYGKLNGGNKGVLLTKVFTADGQTATVDGKVSFSEAVKD